MFKVFVMLNILIAFSLKANAQQDSNSFEKHSIKVIVPQLFLNEYNIAYEYRLNKNIGFECGFGVFVSEGRQIGSWGTWHYVPTEGYVVRANYKFYKNNSKLSRYWSPMILYKNFFINGYEGIDNQTYTRFKEHREVTDISLLTGIQKVYFKCLLLDIYTGGGFRFQNISRTTLDSYGNRNPFTNIEDKIIGNLSLHLGIKLGIGFKTVTYQSENTQPKTKKKQEFRYK